MVVLCLNSVVQYADQEGHEQFGTFIWSYY